MIITARYAAAVHLEGARVVVSRGPGAAALVELRSVSAHVSEVTAVEVRLCGALPFVAVHVRGGAGPERPFDSWSVPMEDPAAAEDLARTIRRHVGAWSAAPSTMSA